MNSSNQPSKWSNHYKSILEFVQTLYMRESMCKWIVRLVWVANLSKIASTIMTQKSHTYIPFNLF